MEDATKAPSDDNDATEGNEADTHSPDRLEADMAAVPSVEPPPVYVRPVRSKSGAVALQPPATEVIATARSGTEEEPKGLPATESMPAAAMPGVATNEDDKASITEATEDAESLEESTATVPKRSDASLKAAQVEISTSNHATTPQPAPQEEAATPEATDLPLAPRWADLPNVKTPKRWIALCFAITFLIYVAFVPVFLNYSSPPTGDQPFYLMDTISIVQDGDLNVKNNYDNRDEDKFYSLAPADRPAYCPSRLRVVRRASPRPGDSPRARLGDRVVVLPLVARNCGLHVPGGCARGGQRLFAGA